MLVPARHAENVSRSALLFAGISASVLLVATAISTVLILLCGKAAQPGRLVFPWAFVFSTLFLILGSVSLHRAWRAVRQEKQQPFRRHLIIALAWATLFMGVQTFGLWQLFPLERDSPSASLGATAFVLALATLHALHFFVTTLFVSFVVARSLTNRYDHEYHWGVTVCLWMWHALGLVWLAILGIFAIVIRTGGS